MVRWKAALLIGGAMLAVSCEKVDVAERSSEDLRTFDAQEPAPPSAISTEASRAAVPDAPGVNVTAAPGVAFDYRYAFRLPTPKIGAVQEAHATICEKLGIEKCRITGMRYQLRGSKNIAAQLALRLDPAIARQFGKDATRLVTDAQGMLVDQEISGIDVGSRIDSATRSKARLQADVDRLDAELKAMSTKDPRRGDVAAQLEALRRQIAALSSSQSADREALAGTPMVFDYGSGTVIPGFEESNPIGEAFAQSWRGFQNALAALIVILGTSLPVGIAIAFLVWGWRRFGPRLSPSSYRDPATPAVETTAP